MPRKPRKKSKTGIYHVIVRGIGQQDIFHEEDDYQRYLETTKKVLLESGISVLGYCLMSNHVHLLLREDYGRYIIVYETIGCKLRVLVQLEIRKNWTRVSRQI